MRNDEVIGVDEIRTALNRVLTAIELEYGPYLRVPGAGYWTFPAAAAFALADEPELSIGLLRDDVEALHELALAGDDEIVVSWHELAHVIGVLRAVERVIAP